MADRMLRFDVLPGHCLAIMLAAWRGDSLVPGRRVVGLERAFNPSRHPELAARDPDEAGDPRVLNAKGHE